MSWYKLSLLGILMAAALYASQAEAKSNEFYLIKHGDKTVQGTKADAMRDILTKASDQTFRCVEQEVTDKLTFRAKKFVSEK